MAIKKDTLDQLVEGRDPQAVFSKGGLFDELKKALAERVLNAELDDHLDHEAAEGPKNRRNGYSKKTVLTERIAAPLSLRKSAIVLKSGVSRPVSHIISTLRAASRSNRLLDWTWLM